MELKLQFRHTGDTFTIDIIVIHIIKIPPETIDNSQMLVKCVPTFQN